MAKSINLLKNLTLEHDLSINREVVEGKRFKYWWFTFRKNYSSMVLTNILFFLFVIPLAVLLIYDLPTKISAAIAGLNFAGEIGMGFPGATNDVNIAKALIYETRIMMSIFIIPCFALIGLGASGLFYCTRNMVWGAKIKVRIHFFRGIKKYWWKFIIAFTYIGAVIYGVYASINAHLYMSVYGSAPWWSYLVMIVTVLLGLLSALYMIFHIPLSIMYKFKFKDVIKNSIILSIELILISLIFVVLLSLPFLAVLSSFTKIALYFFFILVGFSMYSSGICSFGMFISDNFINILYQDKINREEKERKKTTAVKKAKPVNGNKKKNKR